MTNILLVEDEPLIAEEIRQLLGPAGYEVIDGFDGAARDEAAFANGLNRLVASSHAAAVIMDINLAGKFDGVEVGKKIKERTKVPVIFLTGYSDSNTLSRAMGTNPSGYLIKPISGRQLLAQVELTLRRDQHDERLEAQAGLWNLTLGSEGIACSFGWLAQYQYLRNDLKSYADFLEIVHSGDRRALDSFLAQSRTSDKIGSQLEYRLVNAAGHQRWILTKILHIDTEGEQTRISALNIDITEQKQRELHLGYRASHDPLTNLHNRTFLTMELQQHADSHPKAGSYAVIFADLDKFKPINDRLGHAAGDQLLIEVGRRFRSAVKKRDVVARFGGDEFVFLIRHLRSGNDLQNICRRILGSLSHPVQLGDQRVQIGCSLGAASNLPVGKTYEAMLQDADVALYAAKKSHGAKFRIFEDNELSRVFAQLMTAESLRTALKKGQFEPVFVPVMSPAHKQVKGLRIRIRWNHPLHGSIPFAKYKQAAEESGLMAPILLKMFEIVLDRLRGSSAARRGALVLFRMNKRLLVLKDWPEIIRITSEQYTEAGLNFVPEFDEAALSRPQSPEVFRILRAAGVQPALHLGVLPVSCKALSSMPFPYISFADCENDARFNDVCSSLQAAGKTIILAAGGSSSVLCQADQRILIAGGREFTLADRRLNKSERAADNI